jgi:hypothetical protein
MPLIVHHFFPILQSACAAVRRCAVIVGLLGLVAAGVDVSGGMADEITLSRPDTATPIRIVAHKARHWRQGIYDIYVAEGSVQLTQGDQSASSNAAVFWIDRSEPLADRPTKVIA